MPLPPGALAFTRAGERLVALPGRALWWPRRQTLFVADLHAGKGAALRRAGLALPAGATAGDFQRLERLLASTEARRLVVLGDLLHAAPAPGEPLWDAFDAFRAGCAGVEIVVTAGNHDRHGGHRLPARWALDWRADWHDGPLAGCHAPPGLAGPGGVVPPVPPAPPGAARYTLAGHLHPAVVLAGGADRLRLPAFWLTPTVGVLPAFGALTGGHAVRVGRADTLLACAGERVVRVQWPHGQALGRRDTCHAPAHDRKQSKGNPCTSSSPAAPASSVRACAASCSAAATPSPC